MVFIELFLQKTSSQISLRFLLWLLGKVRMEYFSKIALHLLNQKKRNLTDPLWKKSLWAFENRLWWHCHFIQKLETEPEIEFRNVNRAFDGMREMDFNESYFQAWCRGETGIPMIDLIILTSRVRTMQ
jgi:deoxyribodipyrimidine photolyase